MMLETVGLLSIGAASAAGQTPLSALDAFQRICMPLPSMDDIANFATPQGWEPETYPYDIRAGFLVAQLRRSDHRVVTYSAAYSRQVVEGDAYLIVSRSVPVYGSNYRPVRTCALRVFDYDGELPIEEMNVALSNQSTEPWSDVDGNEAVDWFPSPGVSVQMNRVISQTSVAGPADLAGLTISVVYSGEE